MSKENRPELYRELDPTNPTFLEEFIRYTHAIIRYKEANIGLLPKKLWLAVLELNGYYNCAEVLLVDPDHQLVLKVRKDPTAIDGELSWEGQLHIPGIAININTRAKDIARSLIKKEVVKPITEDISDKERGNLNKFIDQLEKSSSLKGYYIYPEPERNTVATTLMLGAKIPFPDERLQEDLVVAHRGDIGGVIEQHQPVFKAYYQHRLRQFFDTRPTFFI